MDGEMPARPTLIGIEGGRAIQARDVHASFMADVHELAGMTENMAGYAFVTWDDQGFTSVAFHTGPRNPFAPTLLPDIIRDKVKAMVDG